MWEEVDDSEDSEDLKAEFFRQQREKCSHLNNTVLLRTPKVNKAIRVEGNEGDEVEESSDSEAYKKAGFAWSLQLWDWDDYVKPAKKPKKRFTPLAHSRGEKEYAYLTAPGAKD